MKSTRVKVLLAALVVFGTALITSPVLASVECFDYGENCHYCVFNGGSGGYIRWCTRPAN
ncbi:MAG: hypothetical protein ACREMY_02135 [bacterium]